MNTEELKKILELHRKWLNDEFGGQRANLAGDLRGADLRGARLSQANLENVNLAGADLTRAKLNSAYLGSTSFFEASLADAAFEGAYLGEANLEGTNLSRARFTRSNLRGANLRGANLEGAYLVGANLEGAVFYKANLAGANLLVHTPDGKYIKGIAGLSWPVVYTHDTLQIGCQNHPLEDWWDFSDDQIEKMDRGALGWWSYRKESIRQTIEQNPALAPDEEEK